LPDHVHFSLSWHRDSPLANFHVTREVKDPNDKPQIRIVEIPKSDLKQLQPLIANTVFHAVYEPLAVPRASNDFKSSIKKVPQSLIASQR
jgi:hypothetical protein